MAKVTVLRGFEDTKEKVDRKVGEEFECSNERADEIHSILGDSFVRVTKTRATRKKAEKAEEKPE